MYERGISEVHVREVQTERDAYVRGAYREVYILEVHVTRERDSEGARAAYVYLCRICAADMYIHV